jgi:uncharacterized membrane protein
MMSNEVDLDSLPIKRGFRLRGAQMSRLETFADAAFAFALTLLVISFDAIPESYAELAAALKSVPAFAASFAIVVMFWVAHRIWSERYGLDDSVSTFLTCLLIFIIMVYVYPLRAMMAASLSSMTGGWVPSELHLESYAQVRGMFIIYGVGWVCANGTLILLNYHALRLAESLQLDRREIFETRAQIIAWSLVGLFGVISMILTLTVPDESIALAGRVYFGLAIVMPLYGRRRARQRRRIGLAQTES